MLKMLLVIISEAPQKISAIFWQFLAILTLLQKPELRNLPETRFRLLLVNNQLCSIPPSGAPFVIKIIAWETCEGIHWILEMSTKIREAPNNLHIKKLC